MKVFIYIIYMLEACSYNGYTWGLELGLYRHYNISAMSWWSVKLVEETGVP